MVESISFCLVVALLLGLVIAWFLPKKSTTNIKESKSQTLNSIITEKEKRVEELESAYIEKKNQLNRLVDEGIVCRHQLLQKSNVLRKKSDELYRVQEKLDRVKEKIAYIENKISKQKESKEESSSSELSIEIKRLKDIIAKRDKSITVLKSSIEELTNDNYIQISKDQFEQIEKKLKDYNNRVDELENENSKLLAMSRLKKEPRVLEDITLYLSNLKESTLSSFYSKRAEA
jgi:chromosome segregation ATPase